MTVVPVCPSSDELWQPWGLREEGEPSRSQEGPSVDLRDAGDVSSCPPASAEDSTGPLPEALTPSNVPMWPAHPHTENKAVPTRPVHRSQTMDFVSKQGLSRECP